MTEKRVGTDLTAGPILKTLLLFSAPIILSNVIQQVYSVVDLLVIGKYIGPTGTVGVSVGGEIADYMSALAIALGAVGQVMTAQFVGAGEKEKVKRLIGTIMSVMISLSIVIMAAVLIMHETILTWLQCPEEALGQATGYMVVTAVGMPFIFGYNAVSGILCGMGESRKPLIFITIAAVLNISLDLLLVLAIPLEAVGTAIATVISQAGSFGAALFYLYRVRERTGFRFRPAEFVPDRNLAGKFFVLGLPQFVRISAVRFSMMWVNAEINSYGLIASSTNNIGGKLQKCMEILIFGAETGASSMVGQNLGARKPERAKKAVLCAFGFAMTIAVVSAALFIGIPRQLFSIFTNDGDVIQLGVLYMKIMIIMIGMNAVTGSFQAMVTGCGHASMSFVMGIIDGISRIGFSLLFATVLGMGLEGYFLGLAMTRSINGVIVLIFFFSGKWKTRKLLTE